MLFLNAVRVEKLTVDGNAFQTLTTLSTKNFCQRLDVLDHTKKCQIIIHVHIFSFIKHTVVFIDGYQFIVAAAGDDFQVIQQEIQMMRECQHQNIVAYYGSYLRYGFYKNG